MRIQLRQIGNSRGVIIPAALIAACRLDDEVELTVEAGRLVLAPVDAPRSGWFDGYDADQDADAWDGDLQTSADEGDWAW